MELVVEVLKEFIALTPVVAVTAPLITLLVNAAKRAGLPDGRQGFCRVYLTCWPGSVWRWPRGWTCWLRRIT